MVPSDSIVSADTYRVDAGPAERGSGFNVVRCEHVAHFDDEAHAAFLVDLLTTDQSVAA
jgi:hypothetical protein